ncbi:copper-transporting ATPase HMA4-like protein [Tanacetum coccineum]
MKLTRTITFKIGCIECASCSISIESVLQELNGVESAVVSPLQGQTVVKYVPELVGLNAVKAAVEDAMTGIKSSLDSLTGVNRVKINMEECKVTVGYDPNMTGPRSLISFIQEAGVGLAHYQASLYISESRDKTEKDHEIKIYRIQFLWSCLFTVQYAEKNELLDEKLEEQVKHIECAAYLHGSSTCNPYYICCFPLPSMQFMPLAAVDTSQDQVLHFYVHLRSVLTPQMRHVVETYGDYNYLRTRVGLDETVGE